MNPTATPLRGTMAVADVRAQVAANFKHIACGACIPVIVETTAVHADGNACLQIITSQHHFHTRLNEQTLKRRDGAFRRDRSGRDGDRGDEQRFFTGKFHSDLLFSSF